MNSSALTLNTQASALKRTEAPYLRLEIAQNVPAVVPMTAVREVLQLPLKRLTPIPHMPPYALGLMYRHAQVLWAIDLARFLSLGTIDPRVSDQTLVALRVGTLSFAIAVHQVQGTTWLDPDEIQPAMRYTNPAITPYLNGCTLKDQEVLLVIDTEAIVQSTASESYLPNL